MKDDVNEGGDTVSGINKDDRSPNWEDEDETIEEQGSNAWKPQHQTGQIEPASGEQPKTDPVEVQENFNSAATKVGRFSILSVSMACGLLFVFF